MKIMVGGLTAGVGFGAVTSLVNALSSPYVELGMPLAGTVWAKAAKVLSLLMDAGWSWAALAVGMGWLAGTRARGALGGALALIAASVAYYVTDAFVLGAPLALFATETVKWSAAGLLFGLVLGVVGAAIRRPGLIGLLAALTVPVGAAVQMVVMPPRPHLTLTPAIVVAEVIVWTAAVLGAGWAFYRFWAARRAVGAG
ncbi:hypothetical protein [Streptomyces jeddahensis]|uniref:ABC-2 family transporter protein n=1 Tax=Streptomyces jeddahensis TaxID=1716141 RepID=A0A177HKD9_9ACTN|nr:hypothetical protein [Streptomyces jeddahensis]OAH10857.1 hypothetical protein STSP_56990 [Streptomyces jeddahensis]